MTVEQRGTKATDDPILEPPTGSETWSEVMLPIIKKFKLAAMFNGKVTWNTQGAEAVGRLIEIMCERLDEQVAPKPQIDWKIILYSNVGWVVAWMLALWLWAEKHS